MHHYHGVIGIIILILDIWAWVNIIQSQRGIFEKILWFLIVFILPVLGFLIWLMAGPRDDRV